MLQRVVKSKFICAPIFDTLKGFYSFNYYIMNFRFITFSKAAVKKCILFHIMSRMIATKDDISNKMDTLKNFEMSKEAIAF